MFFEHYRKVEKVKNINNYIICVKNEFYLPFQFCPQKHISVLLKDALLYQKQTHTPILKQQNTKAWQMELIPILGTTLQQVIGPNLGSITS